MSRLPVGGPGTNPNGAPLTANVSWGAAAFIVGAGIVWWLGVLHLDELLQIDTQCDNRRHDGRGAELGEIVRCSSAEGIAGWFYLAWMAIFPLATFLYLERGLRRATLARKNLRPRE